MTLPRLTAWTLLAAAGFGLVRQSATAQDTPLPFKKSEATEKVNTYLDENNKGGIPAGDLENARKMFLAFANYYGEMVKHPLIYKAAQDPSVKAPGDRTVPPLEGVGGVMTDLKRYIVEPVPANAQRVDKSRGDYIREFGVAFDTVLKPIITENPERIVRVNATRMLAMVCKAGATAHYPTVTELLKADTTPPEVKHYALAAAGNLLSAYDVYNYKSRRHSNGWKNDREKGSGDKELAELVVELERHVLDPAAIMTNVPKFEAAKATSEQKDVVRFIRRQAIRALGEVRFAALPGPDGKSTLFPAYTLAKVCVSDPSLVIEPSPSECAEAVIGLCYMSSIREGDQRKDYDFETAAEAATAGLITFIERRAAKSDDKSLDWKGYGLRLSEALKNWRMIHDFGFNPLAPNAFKGTVPPPIDNLVQRAQTALLGPLEKEGTPVAIEQLRAFLKTQRDRPSRKPLFADVAATALHPQNKK
jgi:hypothetical protein